MSSEKGTRKQVIIEMTERDNLRPRAETYMGFWSSLLLIIFLTVVSFSSSWVISALLIFILLFLERYRTLSLVAGAIWVIIYLGLYGYYYQ